MTALHHDLSGTRLGLVLAIVVATGVGFAPKPDLQQVFPCRLASDTGAVAVSFAKDGLTQNDSVDLVASGLPYNPVDVSLVSDSTTCQAVVDSYNSAVAGADSSLRINSGFVVRAASAFALYLPTEISFFDSAFHFVVRQGFLH